MGRIPVWVASVMGFSPRDETQAERFNALDTTTKLGFRHLRGAWRGGDAGALRYYAHAMDWSEVK